MKRKKLTPRQRDRLLQERSAELLYMQGGIMDMRAAFEILAHEIDATFAGGDFTAFARRMPEFRNRIAWALKNSNEWVDDKWLRKLRIRRPSWRLSR